MKKRKKKLKNRSRIAFLEKRIKQLEHKSLVQNKFNLEFIAFMQLNPNSHFEKRTINSFKNAANVFTAQQELNNLVGKELARNKRLFIFTWLMIIILGVIYVIS